MLLSFAQERLALDLARSLDDIKSLPQYRKFVRDYPAEVLIDKMDQVLAREDVANKGAYFTTLIKLYDFNKNGNAGN